MAQKHQQTTQRLSADKIRCSRDVQPRVETDSNTVKEYAERLVAGDKLPPVVVFFDGETYWLAEGFHRLAALKKAGTKQIDCIVIDGTKADAQWHALQSNITHGLRRSVEDKQRAVVMALKHPNGAKMSDRQIAELVGVSPTMVGQHRKKVEPTVQNGQSKKRVGRDGRKIETAKIGKTKKGNGKKAKPSGKPEIAEGDKTPKPEAEHSAGNHLEAYRNMLENLPGTLDELVKHVNDIAGKALKPKDANTALVRIVTRILVLSDAEQRLAKTKGTK
ncbi:MAG: ParB/RepB/Spo0J family partition protein [Planctomycetota bacterium]